jgi:hypothetical protein
VSFLMPKAPNPGMVPSTPSTPATMNDPAAQGAGAMGRNLQGASGFGSTIITSPLGTTGKPQTAGKSLIGM